MNRSFSQVFLSHRRLLTPHWVENAVAPKLLIKVDSLQEIYLREAACSRKNRAKMCKIRFMCRLTNQEYSDFLLCFIWIVGS